MTTAAPPPACTALRLHTDDNVIVLKRTTKAGATVATDAETLLAATTVPAGHKLASRDIAAGEPILKYGQTIGFAKTAIGRGGHVHTHNVELGSFGRDYAFCRDVRPVTRYAGDALRTFPGFARPGGKAGTRNYLAVISSVNCSATSATTSARQSFNGGFRMSMASSRSPTRAVVRTTRAIQPGCSSGSSPAWQDTRTSAATS